MQLNSGVGASKFEGRESDINPTEHGTFSEQVPREVIKNA